VSSKWAAKYSNESGDNINYQTIGSAISIIPVVHRASINRHKAVEF